MVAGSQAAVDEPGDGTTLVIDEVDLDMGRGFITSFGDGDDQHGHPAIVDEIQRGGHALAQDGNPRFLVDGDNRGITRVQNHFGVCFGGIHQLRG